MTAEARRPSRRLEHAVAAAVFAALTIGFFAPLASGRTFSTIDGFHRLLYPWAGVEGPSAQVAAVQSDQAALSFPWQVTLDRAVADGTLPFWERNTFGGYPLYSNGNSAHLHPLHLVPAVLKMPPGRTHELYSAVHLFLAGLLMYLLLRELDVGLLGGLLGGVSWMLSSANLSWLHFEVVVPLHVMLPLDVLFVHRAFRRGTRASAMAAGLALGVTMILGHVLWMAITCLVAGAYGAALALRSARARWSAGEWHRAWAALQTPLLVAAMAFVSSLVVLLPTALTVAGSQRSSFIYSDLYRYSAAVGAPGLAPPSALWRLLVPITATLDVTSINTQMAFTGTLTAVLAVVAVAHRRRPGVALGATVALVFGLAAIGGPMTWLVYHLTPLGRVFRPYGRLFQWAAFGVALLGGIGLDVLVRWLREAAGRRPVPALLRAAPVGAVVVALTALQLIVVGREMNPTFPPREASASFPVTPLIAATQNLERIGGWPVRSVPISELPSIMLSIGSLGQVFDLDLAGGYDSTLPQRAFAWTTYVSGGPLDPSARARAAYFVVFPSSAVRYEVLARFGIGALLTPPQLPPNGTWGGPSREALRLRPEYSGPDGHVLRLVDEGIGPHVVGAVEAVGDGDAALARFVEPDFPWRERVVLEGRDRARLPNDLRAAAAGPMRASAEVTGLGVNTMAFEVRAERPGLLVIPENWDAGWSAQVNGRSTPVLRGNYTQQVVAVPAGTSTVSLRYEPVGLRAGGIASAVSLGALAVVTTAEAVGRRRSRRRTSSAAA